MRAHTAGVAALVLAATAQRSLADDVRGDASLQALPGARRVAFPTVGASAVGVGGELQYGVGRSVVIDGDTHHRVGGTLAVAVAVAPWLAIGARISGRYDRAIAAGADSDDSWTGDPRACARAAARTAGRVGIGVDACVWLPGSTAPSIVAGAMSVEAVALASYRPADRTVVAANAGVRVDNSAAAVAAADRLTAPDRLNLGVSEASAGLLGVAVQHQVADWAVFGEVTWEPRLAASSQSARTAPLRLSTGLRWSASSALALHVAADVSVAAVPDLSPASTLVPYEPRVAVALGATYRPAHSVATSPDREAPAPRVVIVRGRVVTEAGAAVPGARVVVGSAPPTTTGADGAFEIALASPRSTALRVTADDYLPHEEVVSGDAGEIVLQAQLPPGQLRGFVRSETGDVVPASIAIYPGGAVAQADPTGYFELDVAPGQYDVLIVAPGHVPYARSVTIERDGVAILNARLRRSN